MKVGFITIGQSPRVDVVPEILPYIPGVDVIECGALDGLSMDEIKRLAPREGDYVLVTRLRDGSEVKLSRDKIVKRLQECIDFLESKGVDVIGLLCTGEFPELSSKSAMLIEPSNLLIKLVEAINPKILGVVIPDNAQIDMTKDKWSRCCDKVIVVSFSPYSGDEKELPNVLEPLKDADLIVLDCIGYPARIKYIVKRALNIPVLLPRSVLGKVIAELGE
ncbi:hypothetical protein A3L04_04880 [Thermococcus chitonophagus]|uniref:AroM protein n=1 Tax=Thermococcus chitonophagus TaxID=54262 RepID=A0A160VU79_9EURY|nr:AroM family protein [Thermococcus chitonophagus]ASJ16455.1 hypothetical protein A3L04_04880 [Thermococcus chitonophagus]CUX78550.1 AroM protein [Thermococcus chitonophagus]